MSWIANKVRAYEEMRFAQEPNRRIMPFEWGLEHIGGSPHESDPRGYLMNFARETLAHSDRWFATDPATDYALADGVLTFTSAIESPWPANNRVHAQVFPSPLGSPAVVVLAQWNARWEEQQNVCRWLNKLGITAVKMSLPYHDRRAIPGFPRADHLISPNVGLTLQANRQAVLDVRRTLRWLEQQGHDRLGILGTSIGSCLGFLALCHEPALRAGAFLHVSTYFADVVAEGLTTSNVWQSLAEGVTVDELRDYWSPISPRPYIPRLRGTAKKILAISARHDPTFPFPLTQQLVQAVRTENVPLETMYLPCGHYSLGVAPFSHIAGYRFGTFLRRALR
jgi:Prolyl oligopeptidase family